MSNSKNVRFILPTSSKESLLDLDSPQIYGSSFPPTTLISKSLSSFEATKHSKKQSRTTKYSQKLVLFPEDHYTRGDASAAARDVPEYNDYNPVTDVDILPSGKMTEAERLSKEQRFEFPRLSSYSVSEGFDINKLALFVSQRHSTYAKTFDECLYIYYESHVKNIIFGSMETVNATPLKFTGKSDHVTSPSMYKRSSYQPPNPNEISNSNSNPNANANEEQDIELPVWMMRGEVYIFDYGVIVLWNFTKQEEIRLLDIFKPFTLGGNIDYDDMVVEDMNYQYDLYSTNRPRMFNDMITLKSSSPLVKLTISHALAQSAKLAVFENVMDETIDGTFVLPRMMFEFGQVKMKRMDIMKLVGRLYKLKMNVNLISNVLDTPEIFDSEPELRGLYNAVRVYMEISQRADVLNNRADVLSDLLDMLTDHLNSKESTYITWIIIILICIAVVIAGLEVYVKYLRLLAGMDD